MILTVISIFLITRLAGEVVWMLLLRYDLVRQLKCYRTEQKLVREVVRDVMKPGCIERSRSPTIVQRNGINPVQISKTIRKKFGPEKRKGYRSEWKD